MENFFSWFDGVSLTFSDIVEVDDGADFVNVVLARCKDDKLDYILTQIPGFEVLESKGFSADEVKYWLDFTMRSSFLIWETAREKQAAECAFERQGHNAQNL